MQLVHAVLGNVGLTAACLQCNHLDDRVPLGVLVIKDVFDDPDLSLTRWEHLTDVKLNLRKYILGHDVVSDWNQMLSVAQVPEKVALQGVELVPVEVELFSIPCSGGKCTEAFGDESPALLLISHLDQGPAKRQHRLEITVVDYIRNPQAVTVDIDFHGTSLTGGIRLLHNKPLLDD
ncbi:hypothetical protein D3C84_331200 [compost metagenome]